VSVEFNANAVGQVPVVSTRPLIVS
jgi:hypothetical protein